MENFFSRYKNPLALMAILFIQVVALATQVKRPERSSGAAASGGTRLIRVWTVTAISPFERALVSTGSFIRRNFHSYIDLHNVRKQNQELQDEVAQLKLQQVRLQADADQARRLRALLGFTQRYVGQLLPAQVIGTSGTELSHMIQIDKGSTSGIKVDMPVITPDGLVGKVKDVFPYASLVLLISDRDSGAGVILENTRLQSVLRGSPRGDLRLSDIMADENVAPGEAVVTSGGDGIFPKGLPVGTVLRVSPDHDNQPFLAVTVKPAARLSRLEEVLVVTKIAQDRSSQSAVTGGVRAADILSERLPSVPKPEDKKKAEVPKSGATPSPAAASHAGTATPASPAAVGGSPNAATAVKSGEGN
ncbi:MAG: rod shape-determining protein MreC, partial [Actinomycetota bacterium]